MNRSPSITLALSRAITGFLNFKTAEGLTNSSVAAYKNILQHWAEYTGEVRIGQFTSQDIDGYLVYLRNEYVPRRFGGDTRKLSGKTVGRRRFVMRRPTGNRDQAIVLTLVDAGLRASELCSLEIRDFDPKHGKLEIRHGVEGGAKGGKGRTVYLGKTARHAVWRYLVSREDAEEDDAPLFVVARNHRFNPGTLRHLIKNIASRAGVKNAYPRKFRHTFAITYLRSGGDVFTLQSLLGHGSLDMVRHYAQIAQVDVEQAHRKASPADNWRL